LFEEALRGDEEGALFGRLACAGHRREINTRLCASLRACYAVTATAAAVSAAVCVEAATAAAAAAAAASDVIATRDGKHRTSAIRRCVEKERGTSQRVAVLEPKRLGSSIPFELGGLERLDRHAGTNWPDDLVDY